MKTLCLLFLGLASTALAADLNVHTGNALGAGSQLTVNGNVNFQAGSTLRLKFQSNLPLGYGQLLVNGKVNLGGCSLLLTGSYVPVAGDSFTIIDNDGTEPVTSTFKGLPEGTPLLLNGVKLIISYHGGTGNDVVLNTLSASFDQSSLMQREDPVTLKIPVRLSAPSTTSVSVPFAVGGSTDAADRTISASPLKFAANQTVAYIVITVKDDLIAEGDETVVLTLAPPLSAFVGANPTFTLTITEDDVLPGINPLVSQMVSVGTPVTFSSVITSGSAPLTSRWTKAGKTLPVTAPSLTINPATLADGAAYTFSVTNQRGTASSTAQLTVVDQTPSLRRINVGTSPVMTAGVSGSVLSYLWRKNGVDLPTTPGTKYAGMNTKTLTVKKVNVTPTDDSGSYTCHITTAVGSLDSGAVSLQVPSQKPVAYAPTFSKVVVYNSFSYQITFDTDPTRAPTQFVCSNLPPGLVCNPTTGQITGKPTTAGDFSVSIKLSNSSGPAIPATGTLTVLAFPSGALGTYVGLLGVDNHDGRALGGRIDLTTTPTGSFTGTFQLGANAYPLSASLLTPPTPGAHSTTTLNLAAKGKPGVALTLDLDPSSNTLTGTAVESGVPGISSITGWRNSWHTTSTPTPNPVMAQLGKHSFEIEPVTGGPQGHGAATIDVSASGITTVSGHTADGGVIACTGVLDPTGNVPLFQLLFSAKGSALGILAIGSDVPHTINSSFSWVMTAAPSSRGYGPFGPLTATVSGGKYSVTTPVLGLPSLSGVVTDNAKFTFSDGGLPSSTTNPNVSLRITNANAISANPTNPGNVTSLVLTPSTGAFSGKFTLRDPPAAPRTVTFQGLLVPALGKGYGYFLLPQLANSAALPPTTAATSPILSGSVVLEAQ